MRACYPGSFDPLTVAHVEIARAALAQCDGVSSVDLVLSRSALGKASHAAPLADRVAAIEAAGFLAVVTDAQLLADVADGYDALVIGADKWAQLLDVSFYEDGSVAARDAALARLPPVLAVAPRPGSPMPIPSPTITVVELVLPAWVGEVSSTAVRLGAAPQWRWQRQRGENEAQTRQHPE